jgi:hypothetical protein
MKRNESFIELRVSASGGPWVAVLGGRCPVYGFQRLFNQFRVGCQRMPDGKKVEIHHLPCENFTYEIEQLVNGKRIRSYVATLNDDTKLYHISRHGALMVAQQAMSIREVICECPEMPPIEMDKV